MTGRQHPKSLPIADFNYALPEERIASFPLPDRAASKLLVYRQGQIRENDYHHLPDEISTGYRLVFNHTKVVQARLLFRKPSGGGIEIFCLEPGPSYADITQAYGSTGSVEWSCLVGGAAKWKNQAELSMELDSADGRHTLLYASLKERQGENFLVTFRWEPADASFAEILQVAGAMPIPPYLKRAATESDRIRYQTVYALQEGSVAAPTAGLHFTPQLLESLAQKEIAASYLTLHVGAGTFKPVKSATIEDHHMHAEWIEVNLRTLDELINSADRLIAVGTTSLRTLESLYWMGYKLSLHPPSKWQSLETEQWDPYQQPVSPALSYAEALQLLREKMQREGMELLRTKTRLLIAPGYEIRSVKALVTNFHQPQSTLLLLVASLVGDDWKKIYTYALEHEFRFLSYGDGSLLWKS